MDESENTAGLDQMDQSKPPQEATQGDAEVERHSASVGANSGPSQMEERLKAIAQNQMKQMRMIVHVQELIEGPICGPNDEDIHPPSISLMKYLFGQMKAATEDLKKNIIEMKQKQVEIETKLDVIATSQFGILREVAEIKEAPTRDEDAFFIPSAEDLVEIGDSEEPEPEAV
ncbi:hypothetical protein Aduo_009675 [Ancylostoma duodenale]